MDSKQDKRQSIRFPISLPYRLILNGVEHSGRISNLSLGGVYLDSIEPRLDSSSISHQGELKIQQAEKWVTLKCEVVYLGESRALFPQGVGIAFVMQDDKITLELWNLAIQHLI